MKLNACIYFGFFCLPPHITSILVHNPKGSHHVSSLMDWAVSSDRFHSRPVFQDGLRQLSLLPSFPVYRDHEGGGGAWGSQYKSVNGQYMLVGPGLGWDFYTDRPIMSHTFHDIFCQSMQPGGAWWILPIGGVLHNKFNWPTNPGKCLVCQMASTSQGESARRGLRSKRNEERVTSFPFHPQLSRCHFAWRPPATYMLSASDRGTWTEVQRRDSSISSSESKVHYISNYPGMSIDHTSNDGEKNDKETKYDWGHTTAQILTYLLLRHVTVGLHG